MSSLARSGGILARPGRSSQVLRQQSKNLKRAVEAPFASSSVRSSLIARKEDRRDVDKAVVWSCCDSVKDWLGARGIMIPIP